MFVFALSFFAMTLFCMEEYSGDQSLSIARDQDKEGYKWPPGELTKQLSVKHLGNKGLPIIRDQDREGYQRPSAPEEWEPLEEYLAKKDLPIFRKQYREGYQRLPKRSVRRSKKRKLSEGCSDDQGLPIVQNQGKEECKWPQVSERLLKKRRLPEECSANQGLFTVQDQDDDVEMVDAEPVQESRSEIRPYYSTFPFQNFQNQDDDVEMVDADVVGAQESRDKRKYFLPLGSKDTIHSCIVLRRKKKRLLKRLNRFSIGKFFTDKNDQRNKNCTIELAKLKLLQYSKQKTVAPIANALGVERNINFLEEVRSTLFSQVSYQSVFIECFRCQGY